ncbi:MAG: hypothetical protein HGA75_11295 [Thiobacillus sp.]|nr:hypothetical protein [Thiobacillus sp.]
MPLLPSSLMVGFYAGAIPSRPVDFGYCPPGHFIYYVPDRDICGDIPFLPNVTLLERPVAAPLPVNHQELFSYLRVLFVTEEGEPWWAGDWLADFPGRVQLDTEDFRAWTDWINNAENRQAFDEWLEHCLNQANYIAETGRGQKGDEGMMRLGTSSPDNNAPNPYSARVEFIKRYCARRAIPLPDLMSEADLHTFGISVVISDLESRGFEIREVNTTLGQNPQFLAIKDTLLAAVHVRTDCYPFKGHIKRDEHFRLMREANDMDAIPYAALVCVTNARGQNEDEKGMPIRGGQLEAALDGLRLMTDTGHSFVVDDQGLIHQADGT